jgi:hypothetical protein
MVPFSIEANQTSYSGSKVVTQSWGDTCSGSGAQRALWTGTPPAAGTYVGESGWIAAPPIPDCAVFSQIAGCAALGQYEVTTNRTVVQFRVVVDPDFEDAMDPDLWAACASTGQFLIQTTTQTYTPTATQVGSMGASSDCGNVVNSFWDGSVGFLLDLVQPDPVESCLPSSGGTYDAGIAGPTATYSFCRDTFPNESGPSGGTQISFTLLSEPGFWITVPLADLEGD